jgi:hypothetical protein
MFRSKGRTLALSCADDTTIAMSSRPPLSAKYARVVDLFVTNALKGQAVTRKSLKRRRAGDEPALAF